MKLTHYIFFASLFLLNCNKKNTKLNNINTENSVTDIPLGIGILEVNTKFPIPLYKNLNDSIPFDLLKFKIDKKGVTKFITKIDLNPYIIYEGDSYKKGKNNINQGLISFPPELKFRVVDSTNNSFTIVTNEINNTTFVIKQNTTSAYYKTEKEFIDNNCTNCSDSNYNSNWYIFETWERYLKRVEYIEKYNLKIYDKPNGKIIYEEKNNKFLPFNVIEINGDWIKLKKGLGREFNFEATQNYNGWTQWKEKNKILIEITEHTYE